MTGERCCPACRTPWRGEVTCPRCGADLGPLMRLAARAWTLREAARASLLAGDIGAALVQARAACALECTPRARGLLTLALVASGDTPAACALLVEERKAVSPPNL